ncbi:MAG: hypothetical protein IKL56_06380 [Bacteroidaceae bacterium]|nr:hypothetical protein [Bacteroidaceae bacterium]MBR3616233.1 hypothetical protein [Bacteroidaceae bacterium]
MKKIIVAGIFILMSCISVSSKPISKTLNQGETLKQNLKLNFNETAKEEKAFISWELSGDWDKFDYRFSQGKLKGNVFTIKASEYKKFTDGEDGIALTISGKRKTEDATYNLSMKVAEVSDGLEFLKERLNLDLSINYLLPPPPPIWQVLLVPAIIVLVLAMIVIIVLKVTAKFPNGLLQLGREEVYLKGKSRVSVKEELAKLGIEIDGDVVFVKKRFGRFQGPCIKSIQNFAIERDGMFVSRGAILLPDEELRGVTDINNKEIIIRYC